MPDFKDPTMSWPDYMRQNEAVRVWTSKVRGMLKASAARLTQGKPKSVIRPAPAGQGKPHRNAFFVASQTGGIPSSPQAKKHESTRQENKLRESVNSRVRYKFGVTDGCSFRFERHGVFVHYGVGRGYQMQGGMVVRTAKTPSTGNDRQPVDWFNAIIDANTPELANQIAQINGDLVVNSLRLKIK